MISGTTAATYAYDYQGRRSAKTVAGLTSSFLYDGLNLVGETSGAATANYAFGPGIDEPIIVDHDGTISYFSVDGLGSISGTSSAAGTFDYNSVFDVWGLTRNEVGLRSNSFSYAGREIAEAGFEFYRARFLQSGLGRFGQEDPIGIMSALDVITSPAAVTTALTLAAIMAPYAYVESNPVLTKDPTGLGKLPSPSCIYWAPQCWSNGTDCKKRWCQFLDPLPPEEQQPFFERMHSSSADGFYVNLCFRGLPTCQKALGACGQWLANPFK
jgi:RHS repeat-associated protein